MAQIPLEDLTRALTIAEVKAAIYSVIEATGASTTNWKPGAIVRTIIAAVSIVLSAVSGLAALIARAGFLGLSSGNWKTLVARFVYGVERQEDTFASGPGKLSNSSGFLYSLDPGDLTVKSSVSGKSYTNTTAVTLNPGASNVSCSFSAVEAGSASTAFVGEVDALVTPYTGVSVTNTTAWIGLDAETDESLEIRCGEKLGALSPNGPSDAYAHFARTAKRVDGTPIGVTRVRVVPDGDLGVDVYCATATGLVTGLATDPTTDLGALHKAIQENVVPIPITERTHSATPKTIDVTYSVWLYNTRGLTQAQIEGGIEKALATMLPQQPIGGNEAPPDPSAISVDLIRSTIMSASSTDGIPLGIFRCILTLPASDVLFAQYEAPALGTVTATAVTQVPPPQGTL